MTASGVVAAALCSVALAIAAAANAEPPKVLSPFGARTGPEGFPRPAPHDGVDLAAKVGTPVIAHGRFATVYCHLSARSVQADQAINRGDRLGLTGVTGERPDPGFEHLHFEVRRGWRYEDPHLDPMPLIVGCYEPGRAYPVEPLALTYPLPC